VTDLESSAQVVTADVIIDAPVEAVWAAVTDWDRQSGWIVATTISRCDHTKPGLGDRFEARTGLGPLGVTDPMVVTEWEPPFRCEVRHLGRAVRGSGLFELFPLPGGRCRFVWSERVEVPFGRAGRLGWVGARPLVSAGLKASLVRLARSIEAG
jgi:uncharacterized protein YndB with AHSA1/START domain